MSRERAQALVEAVVAVPACIACALGIVDAGLLVRDRIALAQAADRAAIAHLDGRDEAAAARAALPESLQHHMDVQVRDDEVVVVARAESHIAELVGHPIELRSSVEVAR